MIELVARALGDSPPPEARSRLQNNPTLLFSWWCTGFALTIILFRLAGRLVRTERLFREDKIMAWSIVPLVARMALVHFVLRYGTNNVDLSSVDPEDYFEREVGSRLVLGARIFFALFVWTAKFTISEFLKRLTERFWKRSYEVGLRVIRIFLGVSFAAVVISTLAECQPFDHYWQVSPDPGPRCRLGYANLITMGAADIISDVLLVVFPIPIVVGSAMPLKRKLSLVMLFSMSGLLIAITGVRVPKIILKQGRQQYRSVWASCEILAAAAVSNAVILGSFLRDRGVKKAKKFKLGSASDSIDRGSLKRAPVMQAHWGSDEDLIRDMGIRLGPELTGEPPAPRPAPVVMPISPTTTTATSFTSPTWKSGSRDLSRDSEESDLKAIVPHDSHPSPTEVRVHQSHQKMSFFDVGGLLESGNGTGDNGSGSGRSGSLPHTQSNVQDFAAGTRRGSRALLSDLGGLLSTSAARRPSRSPSRNLAKNNNRHHHHNAAEPQHHQPSSSTLAPEADAGGEEVEMTVQRPQRDRSVSRSRSVSRQRLGGHPVPPIGIIVPRLARHETSQSLQDVGHLLGEGEEPPGKPRAKPASSSRASSLARSLNLAGRSTPHGTGSREHSRTRGAANGVPEEDEEDVEEPGEDARKGRPRSPTRRRVDRSSTPPVLPPVAVDPNGLLDARKSLLAGAEAEAEGKK